MRSIDSKSRSRFMSFRTSLRARVALGIALPILLVLTSLSLMRYRRERQLLEDQIQMTVSQLGEVMMGSLRHIMLANDHEMLVQALNDVGGMETVRRPRRPSGPSRRCRVPASKPRCRGPRHRREAG